MWAVTGYPGDRLKRFLATSQHWTRGELVEFRNEKLRNLIRHCYANVPHYRKAMERCRLTPLDIRTSEDLWKLPVLEKEVIRKQPTDLLARQVAPESLSWSSTGGTTGEPLKVGKAVDCQAWGSMCLERGLEWGGLRFDEPRVRLWGGSLSLDPKRSLRGLGKQLRRDVFVSAYELTSDTAARHIARIRRSGLRFAVGYASALYSLARLAEASGERLRFQAVFPTAQLLLPEWETVIRRVFQCEVLPYYGCAEVNSLGFCCSGEGGYLIPEEHALIEVVSEGNRHGFPGEGELLVTDLDNYAMPILRYRNGDFGKLAGPHGDWPFGRIERIEGRRVNFLMTDKGELISGLLVSRLLRNLPSVKAFQVVQEEPRRIVIRVVEASGFALGVEEQIIESFRKYLGEGMRFQIEKVSNIPMPRSGKATFVENRCLESGETGRD